MKGLAAGAASADATERWRAAVELSKVKGEEAEDLLLGLLTDEDYRVRERAVASLSRRFTPRVASACALALADDANAGHRAAGLALLARGGAAGRAVLLGALQHPSADVRISAATALPGASPAASIVAAIEAAARREGDPNARAALLLALGRTGRREAIAPLLAALEEGYARGGTAGIFLSRFLPGLRAAVTPFAGVAGLPPARALVPAAAASAIWYAFLAFAGYELAGNWDAVKSLVGDTNRVLGIVGLILGGAAAAGLWHRSRRRSG